MTSRPWRTIITAVAGATMVSAALILAPVPAQAAMPWPAPCNDVLFVGARGSGQPLDGNSADFRTGLGPQVAYAFKRFYEQLPGDVDPSGVAVVYPAQGVELLFTFSQGMYFDGMDQGVMFTLGLLQSRVATCPTERIVLAGYSQGAMVMHRVLQRLTADTSSQGQSIQRRLDGAILIADGDRVPGEMTKNFGSAGRGVGVGQQLSALSGSSASPLPGSMLSVTYSLCAKYDIVCDFSAFEHTSVRGTQQGKRTHTRSYTDTADLRLIAGAVASTVARNVPAQPATPVPPAAPAPPAPAAPSAAPTPRPSTPAPAAPSSAGITVNTCNTYGNCTEWNPIWVHSSPGVSSRIADVANGTPLTARCWANGRQLTDGSNNTNEDDARQFTSTLWYGIDWGGGRGYVPAVWTTKRQDTLGLPAC